MFDQQAKYSTFSASNHGSSADGIKNYNRKEWIENSYQYLDSVWSRLKVIQVSKNLLQKEVSEFARFFLVRETFYYVSRTGERRSSHWKSQLRIVRSQF